MMTLEMMFLGGLQLSQDGTSLVDFSSEKGKALLCYLAVTGQPHSRASLAGLLWPESPEANARASLRKVLTEIRKKAPPCLNSTRQTVAIDPDASTWVDVIQFERSVTVAADIDGLQEAVVLYQGDFLERFLLPDAPAFDRWALRQRARLRQMSVEALHTLATHFAERQDYHTAVSYARQLLDIEPWHEETHRELMRLLALSGQRSAALAQYELCCRLLADELGIEPAAATVQLYEQIKGEEWSGEAESPPLPHSSAPPHNLPPQMTPFVGRESELAQLQQLLAAPDIHLITILGPGGMGKTRLALALAASQLHGQQQPYPFRHGVYFASLARLETADLLVSTIAEAINFRFAEGDDLQGQLLRYLAAKAMLLVFDNFEHLLAGTGLVDAILHAAPQVKIVITSRARLNRQVEQLFPIEGLAYPQVNGATNGDSPFELNHYSAVQLFVQCARRVRPDFGLTAANQPHILKICQLLQGMPLGLALAASWLESLSPRAISREVQQDIDFLVTDMGDVPRRQRSLRAAFNHSWRLLSTREREIFCQMSIFRGGSTRAAAQAVTGATLRDLQALVNKSLLTLTADRRYDVHALLRQYGAEKLAENGERETAVRDRHSTYYCQTLGEKEGDVRGQRGFIDPTEFGADLSNMEDAWRWAVHRRLWPNLHQASYTLFRFYKWSYRHQHSLALYQLTVDQLAPDKLTDVEDKDTAWVLARVLIWLASCFLYLEQWPRAETLLQQSQTLLQSQALAQADTRRDQAFLFFTKAQAVFPNSQAALEFAQKSLVLSRASGDQWQETLTLRLLGHIFSGLSNDEMAQKSFEDALIVYRSLNDTVSIAVLLEDMGNLARNVMDYQRSEALYKESLALCRSQGYQPGIAGLSWALGRLKVFLGEFESGADYLQQAAEVQRENGYLRYLVPVMANLANVYTFSGHLLRARQCIEESLAIAEAISFPFLLRSVLAAQARINIWMGRYEAAQITVSRVFSFLDETAKRTGYWHVTPYGSISWLALAQSDLVTARENLQKVVDDNRQFDASEAREWSAIYQATLSRAEWGLGQRVIARQNLYEALAVAVEMRAFITLLHVLPIAPIILAAEDDVRQKVRAIEIYALAHSHPFIANSQFFYDIAGKDMEAVEAALPTDVVTTAKARGQALDFWQTAESLLSELQALGWHEMRPAQP